MMLLSGIAIGGLAGYILARILAYKGMDPVGPDPRIEGRLKLLESASLRHGAAIHALVATAEEDADTHPEAVYTEGEGDRVVIGGDGDV